MQPFVRSLFKLPPENLNEDVDASRLEAALRKRIRGMDAEAAEESLASDRALLESWLQTSAASNHPAHWVLGFLLFPDLAEQLVRPPEPLEQGPTINFDAPSGWKVKVVPFEIILKRGKLVGVITAIDEFSFQLRIQDHEHTMANLMNASYQEQLAPPGQVATMKSREVTFGQAAGKKYIYEQSATFAMKEVNYVLSVPGGFVDIRLSAFVIDFDESQFESSLHTLRLSGPV
jgi:hypothetical protein